MVYWRWETYAEDHPTVSKGHFWDRVWLIGESTVLAFEVFQWDWDVLCCVLEGAEGDGYAFRNVFAVDRPRLCKVGEISELSRHLAIHSICKRRLMNLQDYPMCSVPSLGYR
jgi:hypothetical protein